ncbi:MAG: Gfo/Idh/MocA family oxidoreductase [Planctomycetaceae bacterium]|jgi:myo-inositol 2-dehydrogenase/D-chiro-inositol 1-dehydrogenase
MTSKHQNSSRRSFLQTSSAAAVAGAAVLNNLSAVQAAHTSFDETIRLGLIGCGGRGTGAVQQAMNTTGPTKLVAVADAFENNLERCLRGVQGSHGEKVDVPKERRFTGFDAYKGVLEQDIDLVLIATPPGFRPLHFEAAVAAGKNVFAEKPVAVDASGVRRFLKAAEESKKRDLLVQIGLQRRHERAYMETMQRVKDGAIGHIVSTRAYWNGGGVWLRPRTDEQTEMEYQMRNWYYFNWLCGDHITEQHIHNLDVINWLMDDFPVKAQGQGGRQVRTGKEFGEIYDHFSIEYTYGEDNAMGDNVTLLSQCRHIRKCWSRVNEYAAGSNGSVDFGGAKLFDANGKQTWEYGKGGRGGHQQEHHDLFADFRAGKRPNEAEYGAKSTMTSILGRMAAYSGQEISWDDAISSDHRLADVDNYHSYSDTAPVQPKDDMTYDIPMPGTYKAL